jgi:prolyl-tRNA editing enzyme YbaK/EbsC (Cys-tRNA(Pro) deacylase)
MEYLILKQHGVSHIIHPHPPGAGSAEEVANHLGIRISQMYKSLLLKTSAGYVICCIPVPNRANIEAISRSLRVKKVSFARLDQVPGHPGLKPMGVTPLLQPEFPLLVDSAISSQDKIYIGGGVGYEVEVAVKEFIAGLDPAIGPYSIR